MLDMLALEICTLRHVPDAGVLRTFKGFSVHGLLDIDMDVDRL